MALPNRPFNRPSGPGGFKGKFMPRKEAEHRINHFIRVPQVRLVGDNVTMGVYPTQEALKMAQQLELDLVEISPQADPPVCKIIDYNKFLYDKKRKEKEMKAKSKSAELKEIRFTPGTDDHDFDFKARHAENFLKEGNKVKAYVQFKGRAIMFKERGELVLLKFAERLAEFGQVEGLPKLEGKRMLMVIAPKTQKKKKETGTNE
jgi:translation initiation factor IF-3